MGKFSVRFNEHTEKKLSNITGNTKNGKLEYLVINYQSWQDEILSLRKENQKLYNEFSQLKSLVKNKLMADKQLSEFVKI